MTEVKSSSPVSPSAALTQVLALAGLPPEAASRAHLAGADPVLRSSFAVGTASQVSVAAAAVAACELGVLRGQPPQTVAVDMRHAALECSAWYSLDGQVRDPWDAFSGLYRAADGWVRIHANFAHHRQGALRLLGLDPTTAVRADAERAVLAWRALDFETAAAEAGLVVAALRSFAEWDATPQGRAIAAQPLFTMERIEGEGAEVPPRTLPDLADTDRPLTGIRVLELTRILAGPVGGRALAAHGADVLLVNGPHLPNIEAIADTSRGKRSALLDLRDAEGGAAMARLLQDAHVFVQGYRPGGLAAQGFGPSDVAAARPGIVYVSLTAYGTQGPWAGRRGYDSLVQTAMGFNQAEGETAGGDKPRPMPMQILDEATGYLVAFGAAAALHRQQREGGSWHVQVSLAQTAHWLRGLGRVANGFTEGAPAGFAEQLQPYMQTMASGFGRLAFPRHSAELGRTPARWPLPSMPPGSHPAAWW